MSRISALTLERIRNNERFIPTFPFSQCIISLVKCDESSEGRGFGRDWGGAEVARRWVRHNRPFQLSFNSWLKVDFQGSQKTSPGGLVLVRELDERLGFGELVDRHLSDSRGGKNIQLPLSDLLRQSIYSRWPGMRMSTTPDLPRIRLFGSSVRVGSGSVGQR